MFNKLAYHHVKLSWTIIFERFCPKEMHVYSLSPVIFQISFNALIWNIMVDIFVDVI